MNSIIGVDIKKRGRDFPQVLVTTSFWDQITRQLVVSLLIKMIVTGYLITRSTNVKNIG